ncbi:Thiosulfate reductase precursor [hydrothermal vent metagenome]|uniref:Thiosulfate reductase n=1 Tax=hydrothermal vent metagenome TaxID=652676 RepID=A0A1W1EJN4_9ZZZZ
METTLVSRRKFLQGSVALSIVGGASISSLSLISDDDTSKEKIDDKVATLCEMCVNKCAAIAKVENGIVKKLDPNPLFPKSRNMLCARGTAGIHALYDPDRLKSPMIRIGKRGDGKFKRVTWSEAYEAILNGTKDFKGLSQILEEERDNRSTIGFCAGEGMGEHTYKKFMSNKLGSLNFVNHSSICLKTTVAGYTLTMGAYGISDLENAKYVIMAGANRAEAIVTPDTMDIFKRTRGKGVKLICIDPRFSNTAVHADEWLGIRVGTDLALVLAMTYVVLSQTLYNKKFVEVNFNGFQEYKNHILSNNYTPQWAEEITGIDANTIIRIAKDFMANAPRAIYYQGRRTAWSLQDFQLRRAQALFTALGGGIDVKGGIVFGEKLPLGEYEINTPIYANVKGRIEKDSAAIIGSSGSWIAWRNKIIEDKSPYPIRAMFTYKQNPLLSVPNVAKTRKLFEKMDLVVTIDTMPSDTVVMSDVVLPECSYLEREDPVTSFGGIEPSIALRNRVIEPLYESKPLFDILKGLSKKLSKPLWNISKKYDKDIQEEIDDRGEEDVYIEDGFDLTDMFVDSQEKINRDRVVSIYGEEAYKKLKKSGVYYPNIDKYFKKISDNEYKYYPEDKKYYTITKGKDFKKEAHYNEICVDEKELASIQSNFQTQSGKIECNLAYMSKKGIDAMPTWNDNQYTPVKKGKFKFITGRNAQFTQNSTSNNAMLLDLVRENYIWINRVQADEMNINYGDMLEIKSSIGKIHIKAYPTNKIIKDTLFFVHGFGATSEGLTLGYRNGASDNMIIEDTIEPVFGSASMHETQVEIKKVNV